ncbi:SMI1/KNR4 family protein [Pseudomonas piscis]|uniref:SMI1/KNR4 family protein n=1 Tax=Pseudomonas piscis TaxID=2614538 RepID=UPI00384DAA90
MDFDHFKQQLDHQRKANPIWFELPSDSLASEAAIIEFEKAMALRLAGQYRHFLKTHGGGYFALGIVYSLDPTSDFNLGRNNSAGSSHLLFSDNGCGDFYGFGIENGQCLEQVLFFDHGLEQWQQTKYPGLFSFLAATALAN